MKTTEGRNQTDSRIDHIINITIKTLVVVAAFAVSMIF